MDFRLIQAFVTVAEHGSVSRAAPFLNRTQPSVTRQLAELQRELGVKLFQKVGRRLLLTAEGEQLVADCRALLTQAGSVRERAESLTRGDRGVLRVGASPQMIELLFPALLPLFAKVYPAVQLKPVEVVMADQLDMLERGDLHMAINVKQPDDTRFASYELPPLNVIAAWHRSMGLRSGDPVDITSLADYPLLLLNSGFVTRTLFDAACRLSRIRPNIFMESGAPHTVLALAERGHGIAMVPSSVRIDRRKLESARVSHRRQLLRLMLALLWDKRRALPRYARDFCGVLAAHLREELIRI